MSNQVRNRIFVDVHPVSELGVELRRRTDEHRQAATDGLYLGPFLVDSILTRPDRLEVGFTILEPVDFLPKNVVVPRYELTDKGRQMAADDAAPIPMLLTCPACGERHLDVGEFVTKPHHTHACQNCGMCWRPAVVSTVGVKFLPGFRS